jgi:cellulose biosynthesis protein BcsQ
MNEFLFNEGAALRINRYTVLAEDLHEAGKPFAVIDHDPQQSLANLLKQMQLSSQQEQAELTIIDTPPRLDDANVRAATKTADILLLPSDSSPMDIPVTNNTATLAMALKQDGARAFVNWETPS